MRSRGFPSKLDTDGGRPDRTAEHAGAVSAVFIISPKGHDIELCACAERVAPVVDFQAQELYSPFEAGLGIDGRPTRLNRVM